LSHMSSCPSSQQSKVICCMERLGADVVRRDKVVISDASECEPTTGVNSLVQIALAQLEQSEQRLREKVFGSIDSLSTNAGVMNTRRSSSSSDSSSDVDCITQDLGVHADKSLNLSRAQNIGPMPLLAIRGSTDQGASRRRRLRASGYAVLEAVRQGCDQEVAPDINSEDMASTVVSPSSQTGETTTPAAMPTPKELEARLSSPWGPYCTVQSPTFLGALPCFMPNSIPSALQPFLGTWHSFHLDPWSQGDAHIPELSHSLGKVVCTGMPEAPRFPPGVWHMQQEENNERKVCNSDDMQDAETDTSGTISSAAPGSQDCAKRIAGNNFGTGAADNVEPVKIDLFCCTSFADEFPLDSR